MGSNLQTFAELRPLAPTRHAGLRAERLIQPVRSESALNLIMGFFGDCIYAVSWIFLAIYIGKRCSRAEQILPTWSPRECSSPGETPGLPGLYTTKPPSFRRANAEINVKRHVSVMSCRGSNLLNEDIHARKKISVDSSSSQLYPVLSHCQSSYVQKKISRFFAARIQTWFWQVFFPSYEKLVGVMWGKPDSAGSHLVVRQIQNSLTVNSVQIWEKSANFRQFFYYRSSYCYMKQLLQPKIGAG